TKTPVGILGDSGAGASDFHRVSDSPRPGNAGVAPVQPSRSSHVTKRPRIKRAATRSVRVCFGARDHGTGIFVCQNKGRAGGGALSWLPPGPRKSALPVERRASDLNFGFGLAHGFAWPADCAAVYVRG